MKVTTEQKPDCTAVVTVEVDPEQVQRAMVGASQRVSRVRPIAGFRPGKAPYEMVERAVGKELLLDEAIDELAQTIYKQVLRDEKLDPYDTGKLDVKQRDPLILEFTVPTRPIVTLGDYRNIHLQPRTVAVNDDEIAQVLERLQKEHAELTPVTRPVQKKDLLTIDIQGGFEGDAPIERKGLLVELTDENPLFPWLDQLIGANPNESRPIEYTYPGDDPDESHRGKSVKYTVLINDIKEPQLPTLDDDFAKSISEFGTLDLLRTQIREGLTAQKQQEEEDRFANEVVDAIVGKSQIAFPASMLEDEINIETQRVTQFAGQLGLPLEKYLELAGKTSDQFREEAKPVAENKVRRLLTLLELIRAENIAVERSDVEEEIAHQAMHAIQRGAKEKQARRAYSTPQARKDLEWNLKVRKVVERVTAIARGEPTSGKIITPEMARQEQQRERAAAQAAPPSGGLITDPSQVRSSEMPGALPKIMIPGKDA